jgi:hypothetical protein
LREKSLPCGSSVNPALTRRPRNRSPAGSCCCAGLPAVHPGAATMKLMNP